MVVSQANGYSDDGQNSQASINTKRIISILGEMERHVQETDDFLTSASVKPILKNLHDPDNLPDKHLERSCSSLVDSLDRLQSRLIPSVACLTEGLFSYLVTKSLWTVVDSRVADLLHLHGPLSADELEKLCGIQALRLRQLMDMLVHHNIFRYDVSSKTYENNHVSLLLCHDHWTQWHLWIDLYGNDFFDVSRSMPHAVRVGEKRSAAQIEYNTELNIFDFLSQQDLIGKFHRTLGAGAVAQSPGLTVDYPWEEIGSEPFIDIGAGSGEFLVSLLRTHPLMVGSYLDLQHTVDMVTPEFRKPDGKFADISDRVRDIYAGDFMKEVPESRIYTMKWCLHDWSDKEVVTILQNVRKSVIVSPVSRLLVLESVKQSGRTSRIAHFGDLIMMITANGQERSVDDWHRLAESAGWHVQEKHSIRRAWPMIIDMRPLDLDSNPTSQAQTSKSRE